MDCVDLTATILDEVLLIAIGVLVDRLTLIPDWFKTRSKRKTYIALSDMWESGVGVFNKGMHQLDQQQRQDWYGTMSKWQNDLYEVVEKSIPEKLGRVRTVGLHPIVQPYALTDKKAVNKLSELWATLERLKSVLDDFST